MYEKLIYKDSSGAIEADNHYKETGHYIEILGQTRQEKWGEIEFIKKYKCSKCDFCSMAGEIRKRFI